MFVNGELRDEAAKGYMRMQDRERNEFVLELLHLLLMQMEFGFYMNPNELTEVMAPLLRLLKGVYDVSDEDEEVLIKALVERGKGRRTMAPKR